MKKVIALRFAEFTRSSSGMGTAHRRSLASRCLTRRRLIAPLIATSSPLVTIEQITRLGRYLVSIEAPLGVIGTGSTVILDEVLTRPAMCKTKGNSIMVDLRSLVPEVLLVTVFL